MALFRKKAKTKEAEKIVGDSSRVPEPPKATKEEEQAIKKVDPRYLIQMHKQGIQDLRKLEVDLKQQETDFLYRISILTRDLEQVEKQLLDAGYSEEQLIENKKRALDELDRGSYKFLE